jgi:hypothetical protein
MRFWGYRRACFGLSLDKGAQSGLWEGPIMRGWIDLNIFRALHQIFEVTITWVGCIGLGCDMLGSNNLRLD